MASLGRRVALVIAGTGVYATTAFVTYQYIEFSKTEKVSVDDAKNSGISYVSCPHRSEKFQEIATCYDKRIDLDEKFMGINLLRRALIWFHAKGDVLELAAGTGRNLGYYPYPPTVNRVLLVDTSDQMLEQAKGKIKTLLPEDQKRYAVLKLDSQNLPRKMMKNQMFDTVVDTFGVCSYDDPVKVLREMARMCKPDGKILLLEHGRSKSWNFVTNHLDRYAEHHAANWGCVWNRDLDAILKESGLEIEVLWKWHFGTTYYVVCRPPERFDWEYEETVDHTKLLNKVEEDKSESFWKN